MIAAEFEVADPLGRRRSERASVSIDADLGGMDRALCKVTDLSLHGARLQTYSALKKGAIIWLTLPSLGPRASRVMWADDFAAGCEFLCSLDAIEFEALVAIDASLDRFGN